MIAPEFEIVSWDSKKEGPFDGPGIDCIKAFKTITSVSQKQFDFKEFFLSEGILKGVS